VSVVVELWVHVINNKTEERVEDHMLNRQKTGRFTEMRNLNNTSMMEGGGM